MNEKLNLFMATDDGYIPMLAALITSLKKTKRPDDSYAVRVLYSSVRGENIKRIVSAYSTEDFTVEFFNISSLISHFSESLHTRDYYSCATYFRIFIPRLFPTLKKALYLDCDIIVKEDIRELYDTPLENSLVAAVPDSFVLETPELFPYVEKRIGVARDKYFNAGVLLMNLHLMREEGFEEAFKSLLCYVKFEVAQDQDYLNALCKDRVTLLCSRYNRMPLKEEPTSPLIIHYNLNYKPWQREGVAYAEDFFSAARESEYSKEIAALCKSKSETCEKAAAETTERLIRSAVREALDVKENERIKKCIEKAKKEAKNYEKTKN